MEQLALSRQIGCGCNAKLEILGPDAVLALSTVDETPPHWDDPIVLSGAFGSIELAHGARLMRALTGIDIGEGIDGNKDHWPWLQAALLGRLANTPFACTEKLSRAALQEDCSLHPLRISLNTEKHAFSIYARATSSAWLEFLAHTEWKKQRRPSSGFDQLPYQTKVRVAHHSLPSHVLRTIAAGDIILPDTPYFLSNGEGRLEVGAVAARVQYQAPSSLTIIALEGKLESQDEEVLAANELQDDPMPARAMETQEASEAATLDGLPVTLEFVLGHVRMRMGELRTLAAGTVLQIEGGSPASIAVAAGGHVLGRGELVDVNGQIGIRIVRWGAA